MFPFHILTFALWLGVLDPHFITSDSVTKKSHLPHDTGSKGSYRCQKSYTHAVPVLLELTLYKFYGNEVGGG
jgi:hypothetical protein